MRYVGIVLALFGSVVCLFGIYMWGLGSGSCDTSCGHAYRWLLYLALPGVVLLVAGLALRAWSKRRPRHVSQDRPQRPAAPFG
jgi:hypothetical protein